VALCSNKPWQLLGYENKGKGEFRVVLRVRGWATRRMVESGTKSETQQRTRLMGTSRLVLLRMWAFQGLSG
jgi:hypothetical protein